MYIKEIFNYDKDANEADILITDGQFEVLCYAQPFSNIQGEFSLIAFITQDLKRIEKKYDIIEKIDDGYYAYRIQGEIVDIEKRLARIGKIFIVLEDNIPKDIRNHDFVEFTVMRIDYIEL